MTQKNKLPQNSQAWKYLLAMAALSVAAAVFLFTR